MVRIRYTKKHDKDGYLYLQTDLFNTSMLSSVQGYIYPLINTFKIIQYGPDWTKEIAKGASTNLAQLKKYLKKSLVKLGVTFEDEIRNIIPKSNPI